MKRIKKLTFSSLLVLVFLMYYGYYSYNVLGLLKIINEDKNKNDAISALDAQNPDNDIAKNDQDLLNVDYKTFYDDLNPYGKWIQVNLSDTSKKNSVSNHKEKDLSNVIRKALGIEDAKADVDVSWGLLYIWQPSPSIAVNVVAGDPAPAAYIPYTNGQWIYSDYGWYFRAGTPYEEIVHHYGRWVYSSSYGWVWIPGSVWAPAWVEWEADDNYIGWAPCVPSVYFETHFFHEPFYRDYNLVVVERSHFLDPQVYRTSHIFWDRDRKNDFRDMKRLDGLKFHDRMAFNQGPDVNRISKDMGEKIRHVNINKVSDKNEVRYNNNNYSVYTPNISYRKNSLVNTNENKNVLSKGDKNVEGKNKENPDLNKNNTKNGSNNIDKNNQTNKETNKIRNNNSSKNQDSKVTNQRNNVTKNKVNNGKINSNNRIDKNNNTIKSDKNSYKNNKQRGNNNKNNQNKINNNPGKNTNNNISRQRNNGNNTNGRNNNNPKGNNNNNNNNSNNNKNNNKNNNNNNRGNKKNK